MKCHFCQAHTRYVCGNCEQPTCEWCSHSTEDQGRLCDDCYEKHTTEQSKFDAAWNAPVNPNFQPRQVEPLTEAQQVKFNAAWNAPIAKQPARPGTPSQAARCSTEKVRKQTMEPVTICQQCGDYMPLGGFFRAGKWICASCDVKQERQAARPSWRNWKQPARLFTDEEAQIVEHPWYTVECTDQNNDAYWQ